MFTMNDDKSDYMHSFFRTIKRLSLTKESLGDADDNDECKVCDVLNQWEWEDDGRTNL